MNRNVILFHLVVGEVTFKLRMQLLEDRRVIMGVRVGACEHAAEQADHRDAQNGYEYF